MPDDFGFHGSLPMSSNFLFEVDGVEIGSFKEVHGLELTVETEQFEEGGENGFVHQFPGRMSFPNIVLKRGIVQADALFDWVRKSSGEGFAANGNKLTRCTGAIVVIGEDEKNTRLRSWELSDAFPVRWVGPVLDVHRTEDLTEEIEVAHHGFKSKTTG
ncbi:MAG: hypothetical protein QOD92_91 [Acidimicrobiaceae bacterium]